jgi:hypothetical protein
MEAASASETSVNFYQEKQPNNLGDSDLHAWNSCKEGIKLYSQLHK